MACFHICKLELPLGIGPCILLFTQLFTSFPCLTIGYWWTGVQKTDLLQSLSGSWWQMTFAPNHVGI